MSEVEKEPNQNEESLGKGLKVSLILHALLVSFFTLRAVFFSSEPIDYQAAVRVDIVGLPEKTQTLPTPAPPAKKETPPEPPKPEKPPVAEQKPTPKPPEPKVVAKKEPDAVNLNKAKAKQKEALEKLKAMAALDKIKDDVASENKQAAAKTAAASKVRGNVLSPGTALTGLSKLQHDSYIADLDVHIKKNWAIPEWLAKKDYKAQVLLKIDDRGNILSRQIVRSSGNPSYDEEVLQTVDKSAPFPNPPEKFVSLVKFDGILIGFPE